MYQLAVVVAAIVLFYGAIPAAGAFFVRNEWRRFRRRLLSASLEPDVSTARLGRHLDGNKPVGRFRAFGTLEAIQGNSRIWIRTSSRSVSAAMSGVRVYMLSSSLYSGSDADQTLPGSPISDESPTAVRWERVSSLPEGSGVFIAGELSAHAGQLEFAGTRDSPLLVVFFDGNPETFLDRAIWSARQRNEYWNQFTPVSVAIGSLGLFILAYLFSRSPDVLSAALVAVTGGLVPLYPFLPPGVLLYFAYRRLWHTARYLRAQRDILRLPVRYLAAVGGDSATLPDGSLFQKKSVDYEEAEALIRAGAQFRRRPPSRLLARAGVGDSAGGGFPAVGAGSRERRFVAYGESRNGRLHKSDDPLVGFYVYTGDAEAVARWCARRARIYELISAASFFVGLFANWYLAVVLISLLV